MPDSHAPSDREIFVVAFSASDVDALLQAMAAVNSRKAIDADLEEVIDLATPTPVGIQQRGPFAMPAVAA